MPITLTQKLTFGLSVAAMALGGVAYAHQDMPGHTMEDGDHAMAEGDGVTTRAEAQTRAEAMFARLDVNKDGKLDRTDREARRAAMQERMFDRLDADHDGSISKAEFMAGKGPGENDRSATGEKPGRGMKHHGRNGMRHDGGGMMMERMADADRDGTITQAEFTAAAMKRFDAMDTNHDGQVTKEERQAARQQMMSRWQADKAGES